MNRYFINIFEAISQLVNTVHGGDPNQTFSARLASLRDSGNQSTYWKLWIWFFEKFFPGHLDWAATPD